MRFNIHVPRLLYIVDEIDAHHDGFLYHYSKTDIVSNFLLQKCLLMIKNASPHLLGWRAGKGGKGGKGGKRKGGKTRSQY